MPDDEAQPGLEQSDYDAIEAAVMGTARGRWFLKEFARRNRNADTIAVLKALDRLREILEAGTRLPRAEAGRDAESRGRALRRLRQSASGAGDAAPPAPDPREDMLRILEGRLHAMIGAPPRQPGEGSRPSDDRVQDSPLRGSYLM